MLYDDSDGIILIKYPAANGKTTYNLSTQGVKKISAAAFADCASLISVDLTGVTTINNKAFARTSMTQLNIPASVEFISSISAYKCTSLTTITVDSGNPEYSDNEGILYNKDGTELVLVPAGKDVRNFIIGPDVSQVDSGAFDGNAHLTKVTISNRDTQIYSGAFSDCSSLTSIEVTGSDKSTDGLYSENGVLFNKFDGKVVLINYPAGNSATSYAIPSGVETIKPNAFEGCKNLLTVDIPDTVKRIENTAFKNSGLTSIEIPKSVVFDGNAYCIFEGCDSLKLFVMSSMTPFDGNTFIDVYFYDTEGKPISDMAKLCGKTFCAISPGVMVQCNGYINTYFDTDGGSDAPACKVVKNGDTFTLPEYKGVKDGFKFVGWSVDGKVLQPGEQVKKTTNTLVITAVWEPSEPPGPTPSPSDNNDNTVLIAVIVILAIALVIAVAALVYFKMHGF